MAAEHLPGDTPLYTQVYRRFRDTILSGALKPGARLPSARTLARDLRVSRNTVEAAFLQLTAEGFVARRVGSGTVVAETLAARAPFSPGSNRSSAPKLLRSPAPVRAAPPLSNRGRMIAELGRAEIAADYPMAPCGADVVAFPTKIWNRLLARASRQGGAFRFVDPFGLPALRAAIVEHARLTRGVQAEPEQVIVVSSTQQAIDLAARLLLDPGSTAIVEDPGYTAARAALVAAGAEIRSIPVDESGIVTDRLDGVPNARLAYVTPSHQYPLGVTMSLPRRLAMLQWADRRGTWIIEDDYDSEFRYQGRPIAALQGLDRSGRVLYVGTCNKVLFPGLRLAYLIVPNALIDAFAAARRISDGFSSPLSQTVLADFMAGGHFAAYLRLARDHYQMCRDVLVDRMRTQWGKAATAGPSDTGIHLVGYLQPDRDDARIARTALPNGLGVAALSRYYTGQPTARGLVLTYGATTPEQIVRSVDALTMAVGRRSMSATNSRASA